MRPSPDANASELLRRIALHVFHSKNVPLAASQSMELNTMAKPFPLDNPFLNGYYAPLHLEGDAQNLPVTGELPRQLVGTLYRIGPSPQFAPRGHYDWFAGDGMVHMFRFADGRASYRNRWVRTPKWELEHAEGEGLSAGSLAPSPLTDQRLVDLRSTVANTNVVWHGGRLVALEETHRPFELDAQTLAPKGYCDYDGQLSGPMTAHPKIDPVSGELVSFSYGVKGLFSPDMKVHVFDRDGRLQRSEAFTAPFASVVHDFCVTRSHIVFPIFPLTASFERAKSGKPAYAWEPAMGTHIGIMRRDGTAADMHWYSGDPSYVFHPMNAYDTDDGKIVCDMIEYPIAPGYPNVDGTPTGIAQQGAGRLVRWVVDPANRSDRCCVKHQLSDVAAEFPAHDRRFAMQVYKHGFMMSSTMSEHSKDGLAACAGIVHIDLSTGALQSWNPPLGDFCGEPVFVERHAGADEGDGWLLSVLYRGAENRSDLAVFDAGKVDTGPIGLVQLSHRVPALLHGNWRAGAAN